MCTWSRASGIPVDRAASALFFYADFYGHTQIGLSYRDGVSLDFLNRYFIEAWRAALGGDMGGNTFDERIRGTFLRFRHWFDTEIESVFDIDIHQYPFDAERRSAVARKDGVHLFCYRVEDMAPGDIGWPLLAAAASDFLGARITSLPRLNAAEGRRSRGLYAQFREQLVMPDDMLTQIYAEPILRHFYSNDELARLQARWSKRKGS